MCDSVTLQWGWSPEILSTVCLIMDVWSFFLFVCFFSRGQKEEIFQALKISYNSTFELLKKNRTHCHWNNNAFRDLMEHLNRQAKSHSVSHQLGWFKIRFHYLQSIGRESLSLISRSRWWTLNLRRWSRTSRSSISFSHSRWKTQ